MRKIALILALVTLYACSEKQKPFTGYVVAKEYTEGHMCHSEHKHIVKATVIVPHPVVHTHYHHYVDADFILHVANRFEVRAFHVDTFKFKRVQMLDKITFR